IAWTHQYRIADVFCIPERLFFIGRCLSERLWDIYVMQQLFEAFPVLRPVKIIECRTENFHTVLLQLISQIDRRLAAKLDNHAFRLFILHDVHHIFMRQGFEIKFVGDCKVRRYGFWIVVDDDRLVSRFLYGPYGMDCRIVELHSLSNADRPAAEHQDLFPVTSHGFIFQLIRTVEIWSSRFKFRSACIHHLIDRHYAVLPAHTEYLLFFYAPAVRDDPVAESVLLRPFQMRYRAVILFQFMFNINDMLELPQKEHVDSGPFMYFLHGNPAPQSLADIEQPFVTLRLYHAYDIVQFKLVPVRQTEMMHSVFKGTDRL